MRACRGLCANKCKQPFYKPNVLQFCFGVVSSVSTWRWHECPHWRNVVSEIIRHVLQWCLLKICSYQSDNFHSPNPVTLWFKWWVGGKPLNCGALIFLSHPELLYPIPEKWEPNPTVDDNGNSKQFPRRKKTECEIHWAVMPFVRLLFIYGMFWNFSKRTKFQTAAVLNINHRIDVETGERWRMVGLHAIWYTCCIHACVSVSCLYLQAVTTYVCVGFCYHP